MTPPPDKQRDSTTPALGPIVCGVVTVPDLDEATRWYTDWLEYEVWDEGSVSASLAQSWLAPGAGGSRYRLVSPGVGRTGGVRLVERDRPLLDSPLRVPGWRSLEIVVADVDEVRRRLDASPFHIVGEPKGLEFNPSIRAMQAVGPGREMLYLTQTSDETVFELPRATRLVDRMFIAVLSTPDMRRSLEFYAGRFGALGHLTESSTVLEAVNCELGFPLDRAHSIAALQLAGRSLVEIDQHPPELIAELPPRDDLPAGLACVAFEHRDLDEIRPLHRQEPEVRHEAPYLGRRTTCVVGPAGERIELVEGLTS